MALSYRIVGGPIAQTDNQIHNLNTSDTVAAGETIVIFSAFSVANSTGLAGSFTATGHDWIMDKEQGDTDNSHSGGCQVWSCLSVGGLASGSQIQMEVKDDYHGQSPYWVVLAISSGDSRQMVLDVADSNWTGFTQTPASPTINTGGSDVIVFGFVTSGLQTAGWWTPGSGWTEVVDTNAGTESEYSIALQARISAAGYNGNSSGTYASFQQGGHIIAAYEAVSTAPWPPEGSPEGPKLFTSQSSMRLN